MSTRIPKDNELGLLVGSGISNPAGLPSTGKITDSIFADVGDSKSNQLIEAIRGGTKLYFQRHTSQEMNYEDLYYVAEQLYSEMMRDYPNPLLFDVPASIFDRMPEKDSFDAIKMVRYAMNLIKNIQQTVWTQLSKPLSNFGHLSIIKEILENSHFHRFNIFTLNHDTMLEQYFEKTKSQFSDGFTKDGRWNFTALANSDAPITLLKIHGSINWFFAKENDTRAEIYVKIPPDSHINEVKIDLIRDLKLRYLNSDEPALLIGTTNKIFEYSGGIWRDLFCFANTFLKRIDRLIVCGYGFRDRGVNNLFIDWLISSSRNRAVIVHDNPDSLSTKASRAVAGIFRENMTNGKVVFVEKKIGDPSLSWNDFQQSLSP